MTDTSNSRLLQKAINMVAVSTVYDDPFQILEQMINRVQELEAALEEAIDFVDIYSDVVDGEDGQPEPNGAMVLATYLDEALKGGRYR